MLKIFEINLKTCLLIFLITPLQGWSQSEKYTCWGKQSYIQENIFISYVTHMKSECNSGNALILLEKSIGHKKNGEAIFEKLDQIEVKKSTENIAFSNLLLKLKNDHKKQDYIVKFHDDRKEIISKVYSIWKINFKKMKFIKIDVPKNFKFKNPDWLE